MAPPAVVINGQPMQMPLPQGVAPLLLTFSQPMNLWQVTVSDVSVALETTAYETRADFCDRALEIFSAVAAVALPPVVDRVGLRYIDRLTGSSLDKLDEWVIPQLQSLYGSVDEGLKVEHSVTDAVIHVSPTDRLQVRSGMLGPNSAFDPALPPVNEPSWLLDIDIFTVQAGFPFDANGLASKLRNYAETAYGLFRFATTDRFQADHAGAEQISLEERP
jgi:uncharacterized protein (TIGR04255 family)